MQETSCKMNYGKIVCNVRKNEGTMINSSLRDIRQVIKNILIEKNKSNINVSPTFIETCLSSYCTNEECFSLKNNINKGEVSSIIFNIIKNELKMTDFTNLKDIIISVFCVLNLSKTANNPPPIPYIDINNLWYEVNQKSDNGSSLLQNDSRFYKESIKLIYLLSTYKDKIKEFLASDIYITFIEIMDKIKNKIEFDIGVALRNCILFLQEIDIINSSSAVGTIQFVDNLSKFNTTTAICSKDNIKDFEKITDIYRFIDIVQNTELNKKLL
jgi:hypothetical protein